MPAETPKQAHTAQMAKAVRSGAMSMSDVPPGGRESVLSMMDSMTSKELDEFSKTGKSKSKKHRR